MKDGNHGVTLFALIIGGSLALALPLAFASHSVWLLVLIVVGAYLAGKCIGIFSRYLYGSRSSSRGEPKIQVMGGPAPK
jgi:hypothetical protein